jgi:hypothetical protein
VPAVLLLSSVPVEAASEPLLTDTQIAEEEEEKDGAAAGIGGVSQRWAIGNTYAALDWGADDEEDTQAGGVGTHEAAPSASPPSAPASAPPPATPSRRPSATPGATSPADKKQATASPFQPANSEDPLSTFFTEDFHAWMDDAERRMGEGDARGDAAGPAPTPTSSPPPVTPPRRPSATSGATSPADKKQATASPFQPADSEDPLSAFFTEDFHAWMDDAERRMGEGDARADAARPAPTPTSAPPPATPPRRTAASPRATSPPRKGRATASSCEPEASGSGPPAVVAGEEEEEDDLEQLIKMARADRELAKVLLRHAKQRTTPLLQVAEEKFSESNTPAVMKGLAQLFKDGGEGALLRVGVADLERFDESLQLSAKAHDPKARSGAVLLPQHRDQKGIQQGIGFLLGPCIRGRAHGLEARTVLAFDLKTGVVLRASYEVGRYGPTVGWLKFFIHAGRARSVRGFSLCEASLCWRLLTQPLGMCGRCVSTCCCSFWTPSSTASSPSGARPISWLRS